MAAVVVVKAKAKAVAVAAAAAVVVVLEVVLGVLARRLAAFLGKNTLQGDPIPIIFHDTKSGY